MIKFLKRLYFKLFKSMYPIRVKPSNGQLGLYSFWEKGAFVIIVYDLKEFYGAITTLGSTVWLSANSIEGGKIIENLHNNTVLKSKVNCSKLTIIKDKLYE